jgi:short-subunit dehydrogenase
MNKPLRLVITGATGGIGRELIRVMQPYAQIMIINGLSEENLQKLKNDLRIENCVCIAGDVATKRVRDNIYSAAEEHGGINLLINNAGINDFNLLEEQSDEVVTSIINANLLAPVLLTKRLIPLLRKNKSQIINTGSIFGYLGYPGFSVYAASKFGLRGFAQSLRRELGDSNIIVRYFAPRATRTPFNNSLVEQVNRETKTAMDAPQKVAKMFLKFLFKSTWQKKIGFKESFFTIINDLVPSIPDAAIIKQLPLIKKYLNRKEL